MKEKLVSQRLDPLIYWKRNHKAYPNLSKLVRVYLSPPPSSVASERAFKVAKNVVGDCRLRMRPENLEMNMFLKYNLRALNYSVESSGRQCRKPLDALTARKETQEIQTRDLMMTVPTMKTVILILERIPMMARTENYIISHMIGTIFTRCFGILVVILQFCFYF